MLDDIKKIYRAKHRTLLEDDLEENVEKKFRPVVRATSTPLSRIKPSFHFTTIMAVLSPQVRVCVSDTREDEVDEEQTLQDVRGLAEAYQVWPTPLHRQEGDKDSFKLQLNHVLCCRSWAILPDIMDMFEEMNEGGQAAGPPCPRQRSRPLRQEATGEAHRGGLPSPL